MNVSIAIAVAVIGVAARWRPRRHRIQALRVTVAPPADVVRALPDVISLVIVALHAGLGVDQTFRRLSGLVPTPVGPALDATIAAVDRGERFGDALDKLVDHLGEPARPFATALAGGQRYGLALLPSLERVLAEAQDNRRRQAERAARRLPVLLCFPLALCILPAFVLLTVVPALIGALGALS